MSKSGIQPNQKIHYLPIGVLIICFFCLPFFYQIKLNTGIFKTDLYLVWISGAVCWLFGCIFSRTLDKVIIVLLLMLFYVLVTTVLFSRPSSNGINVTVTFFACIGILIYLKGTRFTNRLFLLFTFLTPAYLCQLVIGVKQFLANTYDPLSIQGLFNNSGYYGNYLASVLPLLFSIFIFKNTIRSYVRKFILLVLLVALFLAFATIARSAILGILGSFALVLGYKLRIADIKVRTNQYTIFLITAILIFFIGCLYLFILKSDSVAGRLTIYSVCINVIKDFPVLGVGVGNFAVYFNTYQELYFKSGNLSIQKQLLATDTYEAFNFILQLLVEFGVLGLMLFIFFGRNVSLNIRKAIHYHKRHEWIIIGCSGSMLSILIAALFSNPFHCPPILLIFILHLAIVLSYSYPDITTWEVPSVYRPFIISVCTLLNIGVILYAIDRHNSEKIWNQASEIASVGDFETALPLYAKAHKRLYSDGDFLYNYGAECSHFQKYQLSILLLEESLKYTTFSSIFVFLGNNYTEMKQFHLAEINYLRAIYMEPSLIYSKYQLIQLYEKWGKSKEAKRWALKTLQFPVKIKSELTDQITENLRAKYVD